MSQGTAPLLSLRLPAQPTDAVYDLTESSVTITVDGVPPARISTDPWRFTRLDKASYEQFGFESIAQQEPEGYYYAETPFAPKEVFRVLRVATRQRVEYACDADGTPLREMNNEYEEFVYFVCLITKVYKRNELPVTPPRKASALKDPDTLED